MLETSLDAAALSRRYQSADPFPHIVLDDVFDADMLEDIAEEIESLMVDPEIPGYGSVEKRRISDPSRFRAKTRALIDYLNSPNFMALIETISGIPKLLPDPYFEGGGIHQIGPGGS